MVGLVDLNDDITLAVLLFCDVFTILSIGQTCKYFNKMSLLRHLWYTLAISLDYDHAPNPAPHESVQSLPTKRLREMVIRSARAYRNWNYPHGPKPSRSISFDIFDRSESTLNDKLLPGGRYYAWLTWRQRFHCYDTESQLEVSPRDGVASPNERMTLMDYCLVKLGDAIVLAYGTSPHSSEVQNFVTIVRLDIRTGISEIVRSFTLPQAVSSTNESPLCHLKIGNEVVVAQEPGMLFVGNWRNGEARVIEFQSYTNIQFLYIINDHLCAIQQKRGEDYSVSAVPLSHILRERGSCDSGKRRPTLYTSLRPQDVFETAFKTMIPNTGRNTTLIEYISICTSSWKTPSLCELDAPATPTRILLSILDFDPTDHEHDYMVAELLLSPISTAPPDGPSISSIVDETPQIRYLLTYERQTLGYSFDQRRRTSPTRTGRIIAPYLTISSLRAISYPRTYLIAFSMLEFLEGKFSEESIASIRNQHILGRAGRYPIDGLLGEAIAKVEVEDINVEEYSSAIWYRSDSTLFIHYTD